jgi:hypothetical protein
MLKLDLNKSARALRLSLDKAGVNPGVKAELAFDIDVSGSFEHEHEEGTTSTLLSRLVPYGMVLDPDGMMDVFTFSDGERHVHHAGVVTPKDSDDYLKRNVVERVPGWGGGTTYSYVLERNLRHFGWLPPEETPTLGGMISRFLGRGPAQLPPGEKKRSVVFFITDGENDGADESRTMRVLGDSQERGDQVYVLFMGMCDRNPDFKFIRKAAERFRNTGVLIVRDLEGFVALSDDELNAKLLVPELVDWLKA